MRTKWKTLVDHKNPRNPKRKKPNEIRTYKSWNFTGQVVKALEVLSPTTARGVFKLLLDKKVVQDTELGLRSVRRALRELHRHRTTIVDVSVRRFVRQEYGTESLIILNPNAKYVFKGE